MIANRDLWDFLEPTSCSMWSRSLRSPSSYRYRMTTFRNIARHKHRVATTLERVGRQALQGRLRAYASLIMSSGLREIYRSKPFRRSVGGSPAAEPRQGTPRARKWRVTRFVMSIPPPEWNPKCPVSLCMPRTIPDESQLSRMAFQSPSAASILRVQGDAAKRLG